MDLVWVVYAEERRLVVERDDRTLIVVAELATITVPVQLTAAVG